MTKCGSEYHRSITSATHGITKPIKWQDWIDNESPRLDDDDDDVSIPDEPPTEKKPWFAGSVR